MRKAHAMSYLFLSVVAIAMLFPLAWMVKTSLQPSTADVSDLHAIAPTFEVTLGEDDVRDYPRLAREILAGATPQAKAVRSQLSKPSLATLELVANEVEGGAIDRTAMLLALNEVISKGPDRSANRRLLDQTFPTLLRPARRWHWSNYEHVIYDLSFARAFMNSVLVTGITTFGLVLTSSLAAYAFARMRFFGRDQLFLGYLATMMVPTTVTMIPIFILLRQLHLVDTYWALILPPMFSAYGVFLLRQFFLSIPRDYEEAAAIDGCSPFGIYWRIILPLSRPGLAALTILTFIGSWRSFMWPLIATHSRELFTLPLALAQFQELFGIRWTLLMAGSVIMIIPMLAAFIIGQRFFVEGIQLGGIKG
jgi:multiple sugar transport system permease protein